jgi:ribulose-phosphate 3-epimerase
MLSSDFTRLAEEVQAVQAAGADLLHLDIMDGCFVPNITFGPFVVAAIRRVANIPLDVHLMIDDPDRYLDDFISSGADILTVHAEACPHLQRTLSRIRETTVKAGVSLNPSSPLESIKYVIDDLDMVLVMSVNPGFSGQKFIPQVLEKVTRARELVGDKIDVEVDGGITAANAAQVVRAGANILVSGSAVFSSPDYAKAIAALRGENTL